MTARPVVRLPVPHDAAPMRVVWVREVDEDAARQFTLDLAAIRTARQPVCPVLIDSPGGDPYDLLGMMDVLAAYDGLIVTVAIGKAMSCGAALFTCGADGHRFVAPNATLMLHEVTSDPIPGKPGDQRASVDETTRLDDLIWQRMESNIGKPRGHLRDLYHRHGGVDWFLSARDAVTCGLASRIGVPLFDVRRRLDPLLHGADDPG